MDANGTRSVTNYKPDWSPRYLTAAVKQREMLCKHDIDLLSKFGAELYGMSPGISVALGRGQHSASFQMNDACWNWLRPLLEELRDSREANQTKQ